MMQAGTQRDRPRRHRAREVGTFVRASVSSGIATAADGVAYQAILLFGTGSYGVAAFAGALLGGVTNFGLNRRWVFAATTKGLRLQAFEYALTCLATYAALQTCLLLLVEGLAVSAHLAWVPAKVIAWLAVSYPVQRFLVFSGPRRPLNDDVEPVSEHPPMAA